MTIWCAEQNYKPSVESGSKEVTFIVPSKQLKLPRRNLVPIAIQKFKLKPKRALKTALQKKKHKQLIKHKSEIDNIVKTIY